MGGMRPRRLDDGRSRLCRTADLSQREIPRRADAKWLERGYLRRVTRGQRIDRLVAAALVVVGQLELWLGDAVPGPKALTVPLTIVATGSVAFRRRWPLIAGSVAIACNVTMIAVDSPGQSVASAVAWMCALYAIAVWTDTRDFAIGVGVFVAGNAFLLLLDPTGLDDTFLFTIIPIVAMLLLRRAIRDRQLRADTLAARAELLEREHELRAQEAVAKERARIARDLHDLVAHNVSVMVIQAGAERHALPRSRRRRARRLRRSSRRGARRSPTPAGCSGCCGATANARNSRRSPASTRSTR
jgi:signal transduction histidine kinase